MTLGRQGFGKASGKIILMGEHSVVYGQPAIALPFYDGQIHVIIRHQEGPLWIDCLFHQGPVATAPDVLRGTVKMIETLLSRMHHPQKDLVIRIESELPAQRGLGSSAAVSIALIRAVYDYFQVPLAADELVTLSLISERINHLNPSGLDSETISAEQAIYYKKGDPHKPIEVDLDGYLVIADSGVRGETRAAVAEVVRYLEEKKDGAQILERLGELTQNARDLLAGGQIRALGASMNEAQGLLERLGVSDPVLDRLILAARKAGALGAKLTGSGKGGCLIALCENSTDARQVVFALRRERAAQVWATSLKKAHH